MGTVRGPLYRPASKTDSFGNVTATPIPERREEFLPGALPYLRSEDAGMILAHPASVSSQIAAAQRNGNLPQDLPRLTLLQAVLAIRADFDRRIRQHAVPPRDGQLGRERFEDMAVLAAQSQRSQPPMTLC